MKTKTFLQFGLLVLLSGFLSAQAPTVQWAQTDDGYTGSTLTQSHDGGIITVGTNSDENYVVRKFNLSGELQWEKTHDIGDYYAFAGYVFTTSDGGYTFFSEDWNESEEESDYYLVKLDSTGDLQWVNQVNSHGGYVNSVTKTADGGFLSVMETEGESILLKINSSGVVQWEQIFDFNDLYVVFARETADGNYILAGYSGDDYLYKLDASGNIIWQEQLSHSEFSIGWVYDIEQTADGGYVLSADVVEDAGGGWGVLHTWLVKLNPLGEISWDKTINDRYVGDLVIAGNGDILITGDNFISRYSPTGTLKWDQSYNTLAGTTNVIREIITTNDGGFAYTAEAWTEDFDEYSQLIKLSEDNLSVSDFQNSLLSIYPNPVKDILNFSEPVKEITVYDLSGKLIKTQKDFTEKLNVNDLPKGVYILQGMSDSGRKFNTKFVKL